MFLYDLTQLILGGYNIIDVQHIVEPVQLETHISTITVRCALSFRPDQSRHFSKQRLPDGASGLSNQRQNKVPEYLHLTLKSQLYAETSFPPSEATGPQQIQTHILALAGSVCLPFASGRSTRATKYQSIIFNVKLHTIKRNKNCPPLY